MELVIVYLSQREIEKYRTGRHNRERVLLSILQVQLEPGLDRKLPQFPSYLGWLVSLEIGLRREGKPMAATEGDEPSWLTIVISCFLGYVSLYLPFYALPWCLADRDGRPLGPKRTVC